MASRSATVLVIFTIAVLAFCLATVFASMTGPLNLFQGNSGGVLDNLSAITDNSDGGYDSIGSQDYNDYSEDYSSSSDVETYSEPSQDTSQHTDEGQNQNHDETQDSGSNANQGSDDSKDNSHAGQDD